MKMLVGTAEEALDTSAYPDTGEVGQVLILQNLGPGDVEFDFIEGSAEAGEGIKVTSGGGYEVTNWRSNWTVYVVASVADTDLRYAVVG